MSRYLKHHIQDDLRKKMVFLGGPRQVGKTTLSLDLLAEFSAGTKIFDKQLINPGDYAGYLNWDLAEDRKSIINVQLPKGEPLLVYDEIHKYRQWRNLIKGIYDKHKGSHSFLITGSARLDYYRRGGDSLQGRYHYYRLHPLSVGELLKLKQEFSIEHLLNFGGFPEPYYSTEERDYKRWQKERITKVLREDLSDLEKVMDIASLQLLVDVLPSKICSPLSIKSIAEDLQVAQQTVGRWINILENLYYCFRVSPYGAPKIRAVKKEQKLYLWDWSQCATEGGKFENLVASQLLKHCHFVEDTEGDAMELRYLRDTDKREVDFVVLKNKQAIFGVECKLGEKSIDSNIKYFSERVEVPKWYQVHLGDKHYEKGKIEVLPFVKFVEQMGFV